METYRERINMTFDARLHHPFSMILAGPSGCGKTSFVYSLLAEAQRLVDQPFDYVVCFLGSNDSKLRELSSVYGGRIQFVRGLPESFEQYIDARKRGCFVLDDLMNEGTKNERVSQLYTKLCHHCNVSVVLILQNLFHHGKERYTILRNSHYLVIFNTPLDQSISRTLAPRLELNPSHKRAVIALINYAQSRYRYIFLDGTQDTIPEAKYRTDLFNPQFQRCFVIRDNEGERAEKKGFPQSASRHEKQKKARRFGKLGDYRRDPRHCGNRTKFIKGQRPTGQELFG